MPNIKSAKKRVRQHEKRRLRNKGYKSAMRTQMKKFLTSLKNDDKDLAKSEFTTIMSNLDRLAGKRIIHPNNANRKKAKVQALYNQYLSNDE